MYICWYINCLLYVHSFSLISNMSIILLYWNGAKLATFVNINCRVTGVIPSNKLELWIYKSQLFQDNCMQNEVICDTFKREVIVWSVWLLLDKLNVLRFHLYLKVVCECLITVCLLIWSVNNYNVHIGPSVCVWRGDCFSL